MRIKSLNLKGYGHFEDRTLEFPHNEVDVHIIAGNNEAGKTTSLEAIGDLLFGVPTRSGQTYKFGPRELLIGASWSTTARLSP